MIKKFEYSLNFLKKPNFEPEEFFYSDKARMMNIDNYTNDAEILNNLTYTAETIQKVRLLLGQPINITSGYRSPLLNSVVGGSPRSQHMKGQAVDFVCPQFGTPEEIVRKIKEEGIVVDQCLIEKSWVHLSVKDDSNRNIFGYYLNGRFKEL
jgi:hypothetical protein